LLVKKETAQFSDLLAQHMEEENNVMYPIAEVRLEDEAKMMILLKFRQIEAILVEKGTMGRCMEIHKRLMKKYGAVSV
jgi:hemerythrin-like domain-containing protein